MVQAKVKFWIIHFRQPPRDSRQSQVKFISIYSYQSTERLKPMSLGLLWEKLQSNSCSWNEKNFTNL